MGKVKATLFREFARRSPDRWNLLVGHQVVHDTYGQGMVTEVTINNSGEISIYIDFLTDDGAKERCFGPQAMNMIADIELPDAIVRTVLRSQPIRPSPLPAQVIPEKPDSDTQGSEAPETPQPLFDEGDNICLVNNPTKRGRIIEAKIYSNNEWNYDIYFSADEKRIYKESDLKLYSPQIHWGGLQDLLRDIAVVKLRKPMGDALYALYGSRTKFEVYQFKPAVKFLTNPDQRLLIADEVGLGKTIEAGIIYLELQARLDLDRVLVVCPSSLKHKWQDELKSRFDEDFVILDIASAKNFLNQYEQMGDHTRLRGIISLESIRRQELADRFADVKLDLLIIDEAHHCRNTNTLANAIASTLTENSDAALLLTATPLQMGKEDLFNLLNILSPGEFDNFQVFTNRLEPNQFVNRAAQWVATGNYPAALAELRQVESTSEKQRFIGNPYYRTVVRILSTPYPNQQELIMAQRRLLELNTLSSVFTRTRKRDIQEKAPKRTAVTLTVNFTPEEKRFYDQIIEEVRWDFRNRHGAGVGSGWVTIMKERQAASCISALMAKMNETAHVADIEEEIFANEFVNSNGLGAEEDQGEAFNESTPLQIMTRRTHAVPRRMIRTILPKDSKFEVFWEALKRVLDDDPKSKILIFSFFVGTIEHIQYKLDGLGVNVRSIHGRKSVLERQSIIEEFRDNPSIRVLVSSDVGSEGLDFQFCDTIFNYDLPWNPMKVEQRIGRIDRFGQESDRIRIYNLVIEDSIESRILMRLYNRIEIFKHSIGDIEVILGDQIRELTQAVFTNRLSPEEEIQRAEMAASNILRQKQEMEDFEHNKLQFLGQEAILSTAVEHTVESGKFVSAVEIHALVAGFIKDKFPLSSLESNGPEDATYTLNANTDLVEHVRSFIFKQKRNDRSAQQFLPKLIPGKEIPLTFTQELAYQRKLLEFITPRHPLAQAALEHWKASSAETNHINKIKIRTPIAPIGDYFFYLFSLDSEGIDKDSRLISVVLSLNTGDMHNEFSKQFIRLMQTSSLPTDRFYPPEIAQEVIAFEDSASYHMTNIRDLLYTELSQSNEAIVNARLFAVEQSFRAKRKRVEGVLAKVSDTRIRRMNEAQLRNLAAKEKAKRDIIETARKVDVSFSLKLRGCVEVVQPL